MSTCPNCNFPIDGNAQFCQNCGATFGGSVSCAKCGTQNQAGTKFCVACGSDLTQAPAAEPVAEKKPGFDAKKLIKIGAIAVAAIVVVILLAALFGGGNTNYALYISDDEMYGMKLPGGKAFSVSEEPSSSWARMTKDGKKLFYEEEGNLYVRSLSNPKKDPTKLGSDVAFYRANEKGNKVYYVNEEGTLYVHNMKDRKKIDSDVDDFIVSDNFNSILYTVIDDGETNILLKKGNKDPEKIASNINYIVHFSDDLKTVVYVKEGALYEKTGNKDAEKFAKDVVDCLAYYEDGTCFFAQREEDDENATLCYYNGKEVKKITDEISDIEFKDVDRPVLVYSQTEDDDTSYFVVIKDKKTKLSAEDVASFASDEKGKTLYYVADYKDGEGNLYKVDVSGKAPKEPKKLYSDVYSNISVYDNDIVYFKDVKDGEGDLYIGKNKVAGDVNVESLSYNEENKIYTYESDIKDGEYTLFKVKGTKATKIADDVADHFVTYDGKILFLKDYEKGKGDLYLLKGSKPKKLQEDVEDIVKYNVLDYKD